jgi:hypothetical protein
MDSTSPNVASNGEARDDSNLSHSPAGLPPEAIALASRFFDAARTGQIDLLSQALTHGLPSNLTNDKGDSLVRTLPTIILSPKPPIFTVNPPTNAWHRLSPTLSIHTHQADTNNSLSQLMLAAYNGHAPIVSLLLSHGADPNRLNDRGQSPLAGVVFKHERECIRLLLEGGADPEVGTPSALDACRVSRLSLFFPAAFVLGVSARCRAALRETVFPESVLQLTSTVSRGLYTTGSEHALRECPARSVRDLRPAC